jgi:hypothetical protein
MNVSLTMSLYLSEYHELVEHCWGVITEQSYSYVMKVIVHFQLLSYYDYVLFRLKVTLTRKI